MSYVATNLQHRIDALPDDDDWGVHAARSLLETADALGCSDLHVLCLIDHVSARARRDGELVDLARLPHNRRELLLARFKVLSRLPAYVKHEPQDGRIEWKPDGADSSRMLRTSFLPSIHGENLVVRFPEATTGLVDLESLGMPGSVLATTRRLLAAQEGTVLLTGPSGSGKTTTLYAMLRHLHQVHGSRRHFLTIENPVERDLGFATQVQVNEAQGMTFEKALRAGLRHDPNVLLIGEIRDAETARICVQAGTTGHLVLSTMHAGRAGRVFPRLLSTGIEPWLAASAVTGLMAQRLARTLCTHCRTEGALAQDGWHAPGCEHCAYSGIRGRTGLFEVAVVTEDIRRHVLEGASPSAIAAAVQRGMTGNLVEEGHRLVREVIISRAEFEFLLSAEEVHS